MLSGLTKKTCILVIVTNNETILSSMLAGGIVVQDMLAGEAGEGERWRRSGDDWRLLLPQGRKFFPFRSNRKTLTRARVLET